MRPLLIHCLAVGAGGFLGALARFGVGALCDRLAGARFPVGTMVVNVTGSFLLGWFATAHGGRGGAGGEAARLAVAVGFIGAYTTFSTFVFDSNALAAGGEGVRAAANVAGSLLLGILAVRLGLRWGAA